MKLNFYGSLEHQTRVTVHMNTEKHGEIPTGDGIELSHNSGVQRGKPTTNKRGFRGPLKLPHYSHTTAQVATAKVGPPCIIQGPIYMSGENVHFKTQPQFLLFLRLFW